ncbi:MAG: pantoate--beta-alanine ligase [Candidatus Competibacteraceae bacterium]|jgi:pantoate--beta-alanine ligase|nr:pantoate--beta-alanine ligase [Candidatus Competibacteraceae bacterium]
MQIAHRIDELRSQVRTWRQAGERIALVPTMGNLHQGHLALVDSARELAPRCVASIFVNPLQFGPQEDLQNYPSTLEQDCAQLIEHKTDLLFVPNVSEIYPRPLEHMTQIEVPGLSRILCGTARPGHFAGVATVVAKLFNMVQPDVAVFGEKDWQQLMVIRRMTADLNLPIDIVGVPTVRETDGLAMSSRNGYLSAAERHIAPNLHATLKSAAQRLLAGERNFLAIETDALQTLSTTGFKPDYFHIRRAEDLAEPQHSDQQLIVIAAAWLGRARLIDNYPVTVGDT